VIAAAQGLGAWLLAMTGWTAALLLAARALDALLAGRIGAGWRVALYAPIAGRLLLPLGWSSGLGVAPPVTATWIQGAAPAGAPAAQAIGGEALLTTALSGGLLALYAAGVAGLLALLAARYRALGRLRREAAPIALPAGAPDPGCPLRVHERAGPLTAGWLRPCVIVPRSLLGTRALSAALLHEAAHVRRGDAWLLAAMQLALALCWPVAPLWIAARRVRLLVEMACDGRALSGPISARAYGEALLDLSCDGPAYGLAPSWRDPAAPLRARLLALRRRPQTPRGVQAMTTLALALLLTAGASAQPGAAPDGEDILTYTVRVYSAGELDGPALEVMAAADARRLLAGLHDRGLAPFAAPTLQAFTGQEALVELGSEPGGTLSVGMKGHLDGEDTLLALDFAAPDGAAGAWSDLRVGPGEALILRAEGDQDWLVFVYAEARPAGEE
jgi:Zn-dependent protease with chaperone function